MLNDSAVHQLGPPRFYFVRARNISNLVGFQRTIHRKILESLDFHHYSVAYVTGGMTFSYEIPDIGKETKVCGGT